jgi:CRP/FNR family transcriptional regulator, cyclic AMP receptor protein
MLLVPHVSIADTVGYAAALLVFITFYMKTMVPLRALGIASNVFFIAYGYLAEAYPPLLLHLLLLPLNVFRLREMLRLTRLVEGASDGELDMAWLSSTATSRRVIRGEFLFRKGDTADRMFFVITGQFCLIETGISIGAGSIAGELGLLSRDKTRTQSMLCVESGELLEIGYSEVKQLYFKNQIFGYFFLQLATKRLFENIDRLESEVVLLRSLSAVSHDVTVGSGEARSDRNGEQVPPPEFAPHMIDERKMLRSRPVGINSRDYRERSSASAGAWAWRCKKVSASPSNGWGAVWRTGPKRVRRRTMLVQGEQVRIGRTTTRTHQGAHHEFPFAFGCIRTLGHRGSISWTASIRRSR